MKLRLDPYRARSFRPKGVYRESKGYFGFGSTYFLAENDGTELYGAKNFWKMEHKKLFFKHMWIIETWKAGPDSNGDVKFFVERKIFNTKEEAEQLAMLKMFEQ